ncbi:unnamed protein product [Dibothriocephalus latus]|uniref:Uncharacterized protein n=1 Tax=Dibothriocephalus latus TaxID=60516 RepID=A0A3P7NW22_DIBLA|nr:unnamed protein product [Dibothriocephalus latus]
MEVSSSETISTAGSDASPITSSTLEMELFSGSTDLDDYYMRADEGPYVRDPNEPWFSDEDVVGHIVESLSATTKINPKALRTFKSVLLCIADDEELPPKLSHIFKQARGLQSPFAHDSDMKQLFVFKDVVRTLAEAKLIKQENANEEALFKIRDALTNVTSATLEEWAVDRDVLVDGVPKLPKMSTHQLVALLLTGELEKTRIRRSFLPPVTKLPPSRVASTVIIAQVSQQFLSLGSGEFLK